MKNWLTHPTEQRHGAVICGAYGMDNAGDDAVLAAIVASLRRLDREATLTVIARHGKKTGKRFGIAGINRLNVLGWLRAMGKAKLFILGGGSLLQDVTSRRSLWFYLAVLRLAKAMGCKVMLYGVGMGPIGRERERQRTAEYLGRFADVITLRDEDSLATLESWGVKGPRMLLAADPVLSTASAVGERERKAGFVLRSWPGFWTHVPEFAGAARYVWERYHLPPVFLCLAPGDREAVKSVCAELDGVPYTVSNDPKRVGRMAVVLGMRLHGLVFALREGVPAAGVSYDPKVDAFCKEAGLPMIALEDVTEEGLRELIDLALLMDAEHLSAAARTLKAREQTNINAAAALLAGD